jgi:hypothetical protein
VATVALGKGFLQVFLGYNLVEFTFFYHPKYFLRVLFGGI